MSTTRQRLQRAAIQIDSATSELDSLASNGCKVSAVTFSNVIGDSQGQGSDLCEVAMNLGAVSAGAFTATAAIYVWFLQKKDGTNFESAYQTTGTTTTPPVGRPADLTITDMANVSDKALTNLKAYGDLPICASIEALFWNQTGQALAATGNSVYIYPQTDQFN